MISASRRTDIPAYHHRWLLRQLERGWCEVVNPFGGGRRRVDLRPEAVTALVLWTRDPSPMLPHLGELRDAGYPFTFLVTIVDYPPWLEPRPPDRRRVVDAVHDIVSRFGRQAVVWRYDPIVLTTGTPPAYHLDRVATLAADLAGTGDRCIVSWVDLYRKTLRNLEPALAAAGEALLPADPARDAALLADLAAALGRHGFAPELCCEPDLVTDAVPPASCVDDGHLTRLLGRAVTLPRRPTRPGCGCRASTDIGRYDTCPRGCVYCYANRTPGAVAGMEPCPDQGPGAKS